MSKHLQELDMSATMQDSSPAASHSRTVEALTIRKRVRPGRWIMAAILIATAVILIMSLMTNQNIDYQIIGQYFFDARILRGLTVSLSLTALLMVLAFCLGVALALMRVSENPVSRAFSWFYTWVFRGVPVLVQMMIWFNLALFFQVISIGIPGTDLHIVSWDTNSLMTPFVASLLGLGLAEAAYVSEIVRGGLLSIDKGQREAASAMGMTGSQSFFRVVMPQLWRVIVPPLGNEFISMFKVTSLASVVGVIDLLGAAQTISSTNYKILELLIIASFWYLACTTALSIVQYLVERRLSKSQRVKNGIVRSARPNSGFRLLGRARNGGNL